MSLCARLLFRNVGSTGVREINGHFSLVFLFFPGLILFAPFINLRMAGHGEVT